MKDVDYYLGFVAQMAPSAEDLMAEPDAPGNYKRADAIADYKRDARAKFLAAAHQHPFTGTLTSIALLDDAGEVVYSLTDDGHAGFVSDKLVRLLTERNGGAEPFEIYPRSAGESFTPRRRLWGLDIDACLRIAAIEALKRSPGLDVPLRLWYQNSGARDPYDILTGAAERRIIGLDGVAEYFGLTPPPLNDARLRADFARRLVARTQLTRFDG